MAHFQDEGLTKPPSLSLPSYKLGEWKNEEDSMECPYLRSWLTASCIKDNPSFNLIPSVLNGYCRSGCYKRCPFYNNKKIKRPEFHIEENNENLTIELYQSIQGVK
jgi:hypothetical protein